MPITLALLFSQCALLWAIMGQICEHTQASSGERRLFFYRAGAAALLGLGIVIEALAALGTQRQCAPGQCASWFSAWPTLSQPLRALGCWGIFCLGVLSLKRFGGPYCGGSDLMTLQLSLCMAVAESTSNTTIRFGAAIYLSIQVCLSYWQSGWVKIVNPQWRSGQALREVFAFTHYPVSEHTRRWAQYPRLLWLMGWLIMLVEFLFPLSVYHRAAFFAALIFMGLFHLANVWLFGLNRFFWIWLATYPTLIACQPLLAEFMHR